MDLEFLVGSVSFKVLNPGNQMTTDADASSIVLSVSYGAFSAMFTGDIRTAVENSLLKANVIGHSTLLRVALHGSDASSSGVFLARVMPEYAVISVGKDNRYGHPSQKVIDNLASIGAKILRTDIYGTIVFKTDGDTVTVSTEITDTASEI